MFGKLLIANRGEIACRVARTAHRLGIRTVAVYSDADAHAAHVELCDEAVHIGGPRPQESYLRGDVILEAGLHRRAAELPVASHHRQEKRVRRLARRPAGEGPDEPASC